MGVGTNMITSSRTVDVILQDISFLEWSSESPSKYALLALIRDLAQEVQQPGIAPTAHLLAVGLARDTRSPLTP